MDDISNSLFRLILSIEKKLNEGISNKTFEIEKKLVYKQIVDSFRYTKDGAGNWSGHFEHVPKITGLTDKSNQNLINSIENSEEYKNALELINNTFKEFKNIKKSLNSFISKIINSYLQNPPLKENNINSIIKAFLNDLNGNPIKYCVSIGLDGIILDIDNIKISKNIHLRKTRIKDLEKEVMSISDLPPTPSAILNIEFLGNGIRDVQNNIEKSVTLLKLFRVSSIKYTNYYIDPDSIIDLFAHVNVTQGQNTLMLERYLIKKNDLSTLKKFWKTIDNILPPSFFELGSSEIDYLTISYNRYNDSIFQDNIMEKRVAATVMGLEALFLKSNEKQELNYKLSIRVSKIFSLLGCDSIKIKRLIKEAYNIRSKFVHGGHIDIKEKNKLENKFKGEKLDILDNDENFSDFILKLVNYLRISIIIMILYQNGKNDNNDKKKNRLIDLIDDSLIDQGKENEIKNYVLQLKIKNII